MKYKRRRSRRNYVGRRRTERNRSKITLFLIILFAAAVFCGSVVLGNYLKDKAEISRENRENEEQGMAESTDTEKEQDIVSSTVLSVPEEIRSEIGRAHV